jgi:hypothetical protein
MIADEQFLASNGTHDESPGREHGRVVKSLRGWLTGLIVNIRFSISRHISA